jgi:hypothetical protein
MTRGRHYLRKGLLILGLIGLLGLPPVSPVMAMNTGGGGGGGYANYYTKTFSCGTGTISGTIAYTAVYSGEIETVYWSESVSWPPVCLDPSGFPFVALFLFSSTSFNGGGNPFAQSDSGTSKIGSYPPPWHAICLSLSSTGFYVGYGDIVPYSFSMSICV